MASRQVVQQHNGGEAVPGANKQKILGAEKKNRRALGDIGNLVTVRGVDGKPMPQVSRPVTRYLTNSNSMAVNANGVVLLDGDKKAVARKPARKKATIKPKPEEIIEISPDTEEVVTDKEKAGEKSSKKKAPTLTSTLTARSQAACGLSNKPKEQQIVDIDAADVDNDLAVVEYVEEMYKFYKSAENEGRAHNYMDTQPEINEKMRAILIDWLVQVHHKFDLSPETFYLTINIVDRYLAAKTTSRRELQLVGLSSMLIASKYEEIWAPEVENMVYFLAELGMMNYETLMYCPSMIAASAVYAARCTLNKAPFWNETLKLHTGFSESQLL
ncbi:hypothetical protein DH2020_016542 [Rehmannia glutinosa]|uniref:Cyclin-like domain-containing protein n=1 Tax=Rehmannia glutinosa TaxID=99300 RepID=A0ABR0WNF7_REHGL